MLQLSSKTGEVITESFDYDGGRCVSVYVPRRAVEAIVFAGDGQLIASWGAEVERAGAPATMVVGVHRPADETERLREYSLGFDPERFTAHERFFTDQVPIWIAAAFGVSMPVKRTAVMGVSASGELAVALGLRHPELYGAILCASPGAGYRPPAELSPPIPHAYFVAGDQEPFFRDNAARWVHALRAAGTEVVATERRGTHGGPFWREEFPLMAKWAFGT